MTPSEQKFLDKFVAVTPEEMCDLVHNLPNLICIDDGIRCWYCDPTRTPSEIAFDLDANDGNPGSFNAFIRRDVLQLARA